MSVTGSASRSAELVGCWGSTARPSATSRAGVMTRSAWSRTWSSWPAGMAVTAIDGSRRCCVTLVHDRPRLQPVSEQRQVRVDLLEQRLAQCVLLQQVAKVQNRRLVGQRSRQPQPDKAPHRLHLVEQVLHPRVAQVVEQLHAVHAQHHRERVRPATATALRIERLDPRLQSVPRNQPVRLLEEYLAPRTALLRVVFQLRESPLFHRSPTVPWPFRRSWQNRLVQTFPNIQTGPVVGGRSILRPVLGPNFRARSIGNSTDACTRPSDCLVRNIMVVPKVTTGSVGQLLPARVPSAAPAHFGPRTVSALVGSATMSVKTSTTFAPQIECVYMVTSPP